MIHIESAFDVVVCWIVIYTIVLIASFLVRGEWLRQGLRAGAVAGFASTIILLAITGAAFLAGV